MKILAVHNKKWVYIVNISGDNAYFISKLKATDGSAVGKIEAAPIKEMIIVDESLFAPEMMAVKGLNEKGEPVTYWQPVGNVVKTFSSGDMGGVGANTVGNVSDNY